MPYKFKINTERYKNVSNLSNDHTIYLHNLFMHSINGIEFKERNLDDLRKRILFFISRYEMVDMNSSDWKSKLKKQKNDKVHLWDDILNRDVWKYVCLTGSFLSDFDINKIIERVRKDGYIKVPLINCFPGRLHSYSEFLTSLEDCYFSIEKLH